MKQRIKYMSSNYICALVCLVLLISCNNNAPTIAAKQDSSDSDSANLVPVKVYGATIDGAIIKEFYPVNATYPNFDHFLFRHEKDAAGDYYVKAFAVEQNGSVIKEIVIAKNGPPTPINFTAFEPLDIKIGVERQLNRLAIPAGDEIKSLTMSPKKYQKHIGYRVKIKTGKALADIEKEINPSPPATEEENDWGLQH